MMPLEDFSSPTEWVRDLDRRWPERALIKRHVIETLSRHIEKVPGIARVLELGVGDGEVLEALLDRFGDEQFVVVDIKPSLLAFVRNRVNAASSVTFVEQDLGREDWTALGAGFDAIYSLQSFHDLGGKQVLQSAYRHCLSRLNPAGMLLNADFVDPMPQDDPVCPRRFPPQVHVDMLGSLGFLDAAVTYRAGTLACMTACSPP